MLEASAEEFGEVIERGGLILGQPVFQIAPEALGGVEFRSVRGKEQQPQIGRES